MRLGVGERPIHPEHAVRHAHPMAAAAASVLAMRPTRSRSSRMRTLQDDQVRLAVDPGQILQQHGVGDCLVEVQELNLQRQRGLGAGHTELAPLRPADLERAVQVHRQGGIHWAFRPP